MVNGMKKYLIQGKKQEAFSLAELVIIIVVIGISIVPLTNIVRSNQKGMGDIALVVQAEYFTQSVMEEVIADYKSASRGYDWVISHWTGASVTYRDMTAGVGIVEDYDSDTEIQFADVVVGVNLANGFSTRLTCRIVDSDI